MVNQVRRNEDLEPGGQSYVECPPEPALAGLVSSVWIQQVGPQARPYAHRNIPNGSVEVVCAVGGLPRVLGPLTRPLVELLAPGTMIVGVRFFPGTAPAVLGLPASELVDLELVADAVWGRRAAVMLGESVAGTGSAPDALAELQRHLVSRCASAVAPDQLVLAAVQQLRWRAEDVRGLTLSLGISERHLRRRCAAAVGYGPKTLHRMLRFQRFLALTQQTIAQGRAPTDDGLSTLAAEAGYADQPHLTRECVIMTGVTPRTLLTETERTCGCGHDHATSFAPLLRARDRMAVPFKP
jgi:AraC-like DNA-binding protein